MAGLPPPPVTDVYGSFTWLEWFRQLRLYITQNGSVPWSIIDFAGSTLSSIASRAHNILQSLQGGQPGEYYHLTATEYASVGGTLVHNNTTSKQGGTSGEYYHLTSAQHTDLIDAGDCTSHYHATDRARANHTGTQTASTISNFNTAVNAAISGISASITLAKLTTGGTDGSITFTNGIATSKVDPT
jgi:hypothetical protein